MRCAVTCRKPRSGADPYISDAAESLAVLQQTKVSPSDFDLAVLVPKNAQQQAAMGLQWADAERDHAWQSAEYLKSKSGGASVVTRTVNRTGLAGWVTNLWGTDSKQQLLDSLRNRKGVIILFAHGVRDGVYTPEGGKLTVQDVQGLDLHTNRPIVLLLSCEGNERGASPAGPSLAQALKKVERPRSGVTHRRSMPAKPPMQQLCSSTSLAVVNLPLRPFDP